ncbi:MAG: AAA family ATPase [Ignavibacteriaceae bacterium]|nr:AAA family ATPase [Ignavibacteriaceae bacterium]
MKIYFRKKQLDDLNSIAIAASKGASITVLTGKRKVGKTTLVKQFLRENAGAYITISSKATAMQLRDITEYLKSFQISGESVPVFLTWEDFFAFLFKIAIQNPVNIIIDEFHNLEFVDQTAYVDLKRAWDKNHHNSKLNLIIVSYNEDFIRRRFETKESPIYKLNAKKIKLRPFGISDVMAIAKSNNSNLTTKQLITLYTIFGGLPKYYFLIDRLKLWDKGLEQIIRELIFVLYAPLAFELKELILNEFSRGNKIYLSILQAISHGDNKMSDIASSVNIPVTNLTKYLFELEKRKKIVDRENPINTRPGIKSKFGRYYVANYFDNFWFRFIQPDIINFESGEYEKMIAHIMQNLEGYLDTRMIIYVREVFENFPNSAALRKVFPYEITKVGAIWNRKDTVELAVLSEKHKQVLYGQLVLKDHPLSREEVTEALAYYNKFPRTFADHVKTRLLITKNGVDGEAWELMKSIGIQHLVTDVFIDILIHEQQEIGGDFIEFEV